MIFGLATFLATTAHGFECGAPVRLDELASALEQAEAAYIDLDEVGFRDKVNELAGILLPCAKDAFPPTLASRHHRLMALHLLMVGDEPGALSAIEAAKIGDPEFMFPDDLLPPTHPLRAHYEAYVPHPKTRNVPEPRVGSIAFDGQHTRRRSKIHPTVAQLFDEQGLAQSTTYLGARETLPPYRAIPRRRNTLILGGASALVVSATMYGLAWAQRGDLFSSASDQALTAKHLDSKRARTNGLTLASGAFLGIAIGAGVGAAMIGEQ